MHTGHAPSAYTNSGLGSGKSPERARRTAALVERLGSVETDERPLVLAGLIELNVGVAEAVSARYRGRGVDDDDLRQVAYEGLVKAVHRFDPDSGHDLLTFAVPTIRGELLRHFRDGGWSVRPPRSVQELQWRIRRCADDLEVRLLRRPTESEVCQELDIEPDDYHSALAATGCFTPVSLDRHVGGPCASTLGELLPILEDGFAAAEARASLQPALRRLSDRDRRILRLRYVDGWTQTDIGRDLGVTQMQVSRLLARILEQLRRALGVDPPHPSDVGVA